MASAIEDPKTQAQAAWQDAKRCRAKIIRDIEALKKGTSGRSEEEMLTRLDDGMAQFRLCFAHIISNDPGYTFEQDAEDVMWRLHIFVNQAYRDLIYGSLKGQQHVVAKRKVEKLYNSYLKTALLFYKGYFQRLEALHGMPQIPRINRLLNLETASATKMQGVAIPAEAVENSFHATLLHLGDISRWKNKARPRPDGLKTTGLYYQLANDLKPTDGAAHHQLGILGEDNHLQIVYHLYRARAIEVPHPNAVANLEQEFKKLLQPPAPVKRSGALDPSEAFANWFTKLHARLYKGDDFPPELEVEVMHQLDLTLKKRDALPMVLRMVLINIAAYWVAKCKIDKEWSIKASASCQYILRLNVRWILVISRLLQSELEEFVKAAPPTDKSAFESDGKASADQKGFSVFTETALPLARIYTAWVYIYRADIVNYQQHLGPHVYKMYRALAQTLTAVARQFTGTSMAPSPYLLAEDVMALGMKPFDDPKLPAICRLQHEADKNNLKPHWEDSGLARSTARDEMLSRIYDLMGCGLSLGFDEQFPLSIHTSAVEGSDNMITISYVEGGKQHVPVGTLGGDSQPVSQISAQDSINLPQEDPHSHKRAGKCEDAGQQKATIHDGNSLDHEEAATKVKPTPVNQLTPPELAIRDDGEGEGEVDLSLDARMMTMVDDLLGEDDDMGFGARVDPAKRLESILAMQATNGGSSLHTSHMPQQQGNTGVPNNHTTSRWDAYSNPSPYGSNQRSATATPQEAPTGRARIAPLQPSVPAFVPSPRPQSGGENQQFGTSLGGLGPVRPAPGFPGSPHGNLGHSRQKFGGSADSIGFSPILSPMRGSRGSKSQAGRQPIAKQSVTTSPPPGLGFDKDSFSTAFSHTSSSLPTLNSPLGLSTAKFDGAFGQRETPANYQTYGSYLRNQNQYQQPNAYEAASNDDVYNTATAYGRGSIAYDQPTLERPVARNDAQSKR